MTEENTMFWYLEIIGYCKICKQTIVFLVILSLEASLIKEEIINTIFVFMWEVLIMRFLANSCLPSKGKAHVAYA